MRDASFRVLVVYAGGELSGYDYAPGGAFSALCKSENIVAVVQCAGIEIHNSAARIKRGLVYHTASHIVQRYIDLLPH